MEENIQIIYWCYIWRICTHSRNTVLYGSFSTADPKDVLGERSVWYLSCIELWTRPRYIIRPRFEEVLRCLQLSDSDVKHEQVLNYLEAVNLQFADAFNPGDTICLDESMVKSFHHDLKGKMKLIWKPRPIGNEFKNASDARTNIVATLELYEGRELMAEKEFVDEYGATTQQQR